VPPRTLTAKLGALLSPILEALVRALAHVSADVLTMTGLALTGVASAFFALAGGPGYISPVTLRVGGVIALVGAIFDMLDGRVARLRGRETKFGAFLDSTMDRYSDMLLLGLLILYARLSAPAQAVWVAFGSFMTSYRGRGRKPHPRCPVGLMERPERVVLVIAGAILNQMVAVL
jgi:CDP-diacylglycerol--glycerol-3-phosphate 3-phosphatidyltransferase